MSHLVVLYQTALRRERSVSMVRKTHRVTHHCPLRQNCHSSLTSSTSESFSATNFALFAAALLLLSPRRFYLDAFRTASRGSSSPGCAQKSSRPGKEFTSSRHQMNGWESSDGDTTTSLTVWPIQVVSAGWYTKILSQSLTCNASKGFM